jgi:choline dehydrogenase-like flavoprotein
MGNDPKTSVVDKYNNAHEVKNLYVVDGSSFVTHGQRQLTPTIQGRGLPACRSPDSGSEEERNQGEC